MTKRSDDILKAIEVWGARKCVCVWIRGDSG